MNKTFTLVWSAARSAFIVAHEHAKSHGKPSSTSKSAATAAVLLGLLGNAGFALAAPPVAPPVNALPTGGQVAAGAASITQSASRMDITQSTQKAILNWQSFNIGADAQVNFAQPNASAVALNRVLSSDPSAIYGKLNANGQVFLLNPSGVLFGAGARVDVGGLVASTMKLDDADFMAGNYKFSGGSGSVINQGQLKAALGGYIALLAFAKPGEPPREVWRYDFDHYTCFPTLLAADVDGDGNGDLAWQTPDGTAAGWFMNSNGTTRAASFWGNTGSWKLKAAGR